MSDTTDVSAPDVVEALRIAGEMIAAGIPVFAAPPCPSGPFGGLKGYACSRPGHDGGGVDYDLPAAWQLTVASPVWLERWQPGWALGAVGGHVADFLDEDPRNGGLLSVAEMISSGQWPNIYGVQQTASGGNHYLISPAGERKITGLLPGLDYQGGAPDGKGRGFVWLAPTVRIAKAGELAGQPVAYRWLQEPDLDWLADYGTDEGGTGSLDSSLDGLRLRIAGWRARGTKATGEARERSGSLARTFTPGQMEAFLAPALAAVAGAQVGSIEETANAAACMLSHFVPSMLTLDAAFDRLTDALGQTAYDPAHPASRWNADKFRAVIGDVGGRAPADWHAVAVAEGSSVAPDVALAEAVAAVDPEGDEVSALLAEMLPPSVLREREAPRYMIKGLLSYDSEVWMVGGPGSKKSFVVLDMAAHVARGEAWQGHRVNRGVALLIVGEGAGSIGNRIKAWEKQYGQMPDDGVRILPRPVQAADLSAWAVLVAACARLRAALPADMGMFIAVDTQARSTVGLDENSAEQMGVYVQALAALRAATGGCVMSVHHTTKAGGSTRGSGAQDGAQYSRLLMRSEKPGQDGQLVSKLISDKQKDMEEAAPLELRFSKVALGLDQDGEAITSLVLTPRDEWREAEAGPGMFAGLDRDGVAVVTPFAVRGEPELWTHRITVPQAKLQRWLLQALVDTAEDRGLTQSEWRGVVEEKIGKQTATTWRKAFQVVTSGQGQIGESGVVLKVQGADRWMVDRVAIAGVTAE